MISIVQRKHGTTSATFDSDVTAGNTILVLVCSYEPASSTTVPKGLIVTLGLQLP